LGDGAAFSEVFQASSESRLELDAGHLRRLREAIRSCLACRNRASRSPDGFEHRLRFQVNGREYEWAVWPVDERHPLAAKAPLTTRRQRELLRIVQDVARRVLATRLLVSYTRHDDTAASSRLTIHRGGAYVFGQDDWGPAVEGKFDAPTVRRLRSLIEAADLSPGTTTRSASPDRHGRELNSYFTGASLQMVPKRADGRRARRIDPRKRRLVARLDALLREVLRRHLASERRQAISRRLVLRAGRDLLPSAGLRVMGARPGDRLGASVSSAGDVNGDGLRDFVFGAPRADARGGLEAGAAYVVFGRRGSATVDLARSGFGGFRIEGAAPRESLGRSVAGIGDVNADGLDDLLVGAPGADHRGRASSGSAYVVYGRRETTPIAVADLGRRGVRLDGAVGREAAGAGVSAGGDVNGDRVPDFIVGVGTPQTDSDPRSATAYVVFGGRRFPRALDLGQLGSRGYRIFFRTRSFILPAEATLAGDVNGDGLDDTVLGGTLVWHSREIRSGRLIDRYVSSFENERAFVVFGKANDQPVNTAELSAEGFDVRLAEPQEQYSLGDAVVGAGDVNHDGLADIAIGAPGYHGRGVQRGAVFTVYGTATGGPIDPTVPGAGYRIDAPRDYGFAGGALAKAGDVDRDGRSDLLIGAPGSGSACNEGPGRAFLALTGGLDTPRLRGYQLAGLPRSADLGSSVAAEPARGSRPAMLVLGAPGVSPGGARTEAGAAYVVSSRTLTRLPPIAFRDVKHRCRS
jgi:hypothetical protein